METFVKIIQLVISMTLVLVILLQVRETGSGLFGSAQASYRTRRGLEKTLFQFTIVLAVVFLIMSIISVNYA